MDCPARLIIPSDTEWNSHWIVKPSKSFDSIKIHMKQWQKEWTLTGTLLEETTGHDLSVSCSSWLLHVYACCTIEAFLWQHFHWNSSNTPWIEGPVDFYKWHVSWIEGPVDFYTLACFLDWRTSWFLHPGMWYVLIYREQSCILGCNAR